MKVLIAALLLCVSASAQQTTWTSVAEPPSTMDAAFVTAAAGLTGAMIADIETTVGALNRCPRCRETNRLAVALFGSRPARGQLYAVGIAQAAAASGVGYYLKNFCEKRRTIMDLYGNIWKRRMGPVCSVAWRLPFLILGGSHIRGAAHNYGVMR